MVYVVGKKLPYGRRLEMPEEPALVLEVELSEAGGFARQEVSPRLRFVPIDEAWQPGRVLIAMQSSSQAWATDLNRLYQPDHPVITNILSLLEYLEHVVWDSDRHGWAWQRRAERWITS